MKIELEEIKKWIKEKRVDDYWTENDWDGNLNCGKEICLDELEDFLKDFTLVSNSETNEEAKK